jgi:DNA mismatch endonuclease (patch repair protein)
MADVFSPEKRSDVMSRIKSKNTKAELIAFRYLRREKVYFQRHYKRVAGTPDIALPRKKRAVFIDSDFWHGQTYNALIKRRGSKDDYWVKKIKANMERDMKQRKKLKNGGWSLLVLWESDIIRKKTREHTLQLLKDFLA